MSAIYEARPPRPFLQHAASMMSAKGMDYKSPPGKSYGALNQTDFAVALELAARDNPLGWCAFWAKWMDDPSARIDLGVRLYAVGAKIRKDEMMPKLAALAAVEHCDGRLSVRQLCRALRCCPTKTLPKYRKAYDEMVKHAGVAEYRFGGAVRCIIG